MNKPIQGLTTVQERSVVLQRGYWGQDAASDRPSRLREKTYSPGTTKANRGRGTGDQEDPRPFNGAPKEQSLVWTKSTLPVRRAAAQLQAAEPENGFTSSQTAGSFRYQREVPVVRRYDLPGIKWFLQKSFKRNVWNIIKNNEVHEEAKQRAEAVISGKRHKGSRRPLPPRPLRTALKTKTDGEFWRPQKPKNRTRISEREKTNPKQK